MKMNFMMIVFMMMSLLILTSCVPLTDSGGNRLKSIDLAGTSVLMKADTPEKATQAAVKAMVKGSIYETGEQVSLFGTCLNSSDDPVLTGNVSAVINAWYPNGTSFITMSIMSEMQPGYFVYISPMSAVQGTYLTELVCTFDGFPVAKAWGEWQNPMWVAKIGMINNTLTGMNMTLNSFIVDVANNLTAISMQINDLYSNISIGNVTVNLNTTLLEEMMMNASQQIYELRMVTESGFANQTTMITDLNNTFVVGLQNLTSQYQVITNSLYDLSVQINSSYSDMLLNLTSQLNEIQINLQNITGIIMENNALLLNLTGSVSNLSVQIGNMQVNVSDSFGITWDMMSALNISSNASFYNITQQLIEVANVANSSVDRTDSYLAIILRLLAYTEGAPVTRELNWTVETSPDPPKYYKDWKVYVRLINEYGNQIAGPIATCRISTNNLPATVNETMEIVGNAGYDRRGWQGYDGHAYYYWEEQMMRPPGFDFNYTVNCSYN